MLVLVKVKVVVVVALQEMEHLNKKHKN